MTQQPTTPTLHDVGLYDGASEAALRERPLSVPKIFIRGRGR